AKTDPLKTITATRSGPAQPLRRRCPNPGDESADTRGGNRLQPAGKPTMPTQFLNPPGLAPTNGWTHVVTSTGGKTVHVSGQVGVDEGGEVVGKGDLKAQTEQVFANLEVALKAAGASIRDLVKMNLYVVGLKPE